MSVNPIRPTFPGMQTPKMYVLKQGNKSLSLIHCERHYVIGFQSSSMARKVHYNLHPAVGTGPSSPNMRLERYEEIDVTQEVKQGLGDLDVPFRAQSVTIDTQATLFLPKHEVGAPHDPSNDMGIHLSTVDVSDFMMYPFENQLGIIMPYDLVHERPHEFLFKAQVIDPCIDPMSFLRSLMLGP